MKRPFDFLPDRICLLAVALLTAWATTPALAQQDRHEGLVDDWSSHHVIFSNPGTLQDAMMNGRREEWERTVNDPRYHMQQIKRGLSEAGKTAASAVSVPRAPDSESLDSNSDHVSVKHRRPPRNNPLHADWSVPLSATANTGVALGMGPAKYSLSIAGTPSCSDYVVFPVNAPGSSTQANLVGVSNLYNPTCGTDQPVLLFAYHVGSGTVQTSPVLSLDGTKVAFVETIQNGSRFHVLTLDQRGNGGCPNLSPCNGTNWNVPATPGTLNSAVDTTITFTGPFPPQGVMITRSSPFVDYTSDTAYVGDDNGQLHKITGVFKGTPTQAGSPWPVQIFPGTFRPIFTPVFDSGSQRIFIPADDGRLYCITSAGAACSPTSNIALTDGQASFTLPIVDSTTGKVFAAGETGGRAILTQATTALGTVVKVDMGFGDASVPLYRGAFDHAYFTSVGTGHMYFCGDVDGVATPTLYRVGFNSSGTINSTKDPSPASFQLVSSGNVGPNVNCAPLIEVFNTSQNTDYLFVGVRSHGAPSAGCADSTCIMSFILPTSSPFTFPTAPHATLRTAIPPENNGTSDMIIDNVSGAAGASQIYFGNLQNQTGVQASQSALQ